MIDLLIIRLYLSRRDWCGIGHPHRMLCWTWRGIPRSIVW